MASQILVTGGTGFIGSHTLIELLAAGYDCVVLDNLSNSSPESLARVQQISGKSVPFQQADIRNRGALDAIFDAYDFDAVIHFAGLKAVGESVDKPLEYYDNNIGGTLTLLQSMAAHGVKNIIFSSSATVYGDPAFVPITEDCPKGQVTNPYGWTKWMIEQILEDTAKSDPEWNVVLLRYFNPVGAHPSGLMGEDPKGIPNNLCPYITQVAVGKLSKLGVFGDDYDTPDGTGVRDYIHVVDLAKGHVKALQWMFSPMLSSSADASVARHGCEVFNLGTGRGYSVLDMLHAFEKAVGHSIPYEIKARRAGDIASCYCDPAKAQRILGWKAQLDQDDMCADSWRWQSANPNGYNTGEI